jgi:hypothetical protein
MNNSNGQIMPPKRKAILKPVSSQLQEPVSKTQDQAHSEKQRFQNDGRYVLLQELPSQYHPRFGYDFEELWIRQLTTNEARLIHMAKVSNNITYLISAVGACLSQPINKLIVEDFEFCLYWLRLNSYPARPFHVTWTCDNELEDLDENGNKKICGHKDQLSQIKKSDITINHIPDDFKMLPEVAFPTMRFFEELDSLRRRIESFKNSDLTDEDEEKEYTSLMGDLYLADIAQWIKAGDSLAEKLMILNEQPNLVLQEKIEGFVEKLPQFGVSEWISLKCQACGGIMRRKLTLNYLSFFP